MKNYQGHFIWKNIALTSVILLMLSSSNKARITQVVILSLILACVHLLVVLANSKKSNKTMVTISLGFEVVLLCLCDVKFGQILIMVTLLELIDYHTEGELFYILTFTSFVLVGLVFYENSYIIVIQLVLLIGFMLTRHMANKIAFYKEKSLDDKAIIAYLNQQIVEMKQHGKTIREVAILEERNRFSGRIHDKVGHSISGSIILLEATMLIFDSQQEKAKDNIKRAVDNLRNGVDDIRKSLREERPKLPILNITEIKATLERFTLEYGIATSIETQSELDVIQVEIWNCVHGNLQEVLTNILKHSKATYFILKITIINKIIRIEYVNDGVKSTIDKKGIGLMAMEERTSFLGGTSLALVEDGVFSLTNVFIINH